MPKPKLRAHDVTIPKTSTHLWSGEEVPGGTFHLTPKNDTGTIQRYRVQNEKGEHIGELSRYINHFTDKVDWCGWPTDTEGNKVGYGEVFPLHRRTRKEAMIDLMHHAFAAATASERAGKMDT